MRLIENHIFGDSRGNLVAIEGLQDIPFEIRRVFFIYGVESEVYRGQHSHYKTKQYLIAVSGSCKVTLFDGFSKKTYHLDHPSSGVLQNELVWGEMHDFSEDCVLLVLASEYYNDADYIRSFDDFMILASK